MSRRRHQKGSVAVRNGIFRGWYRQYPEGDRVVVKLGRVAEITKRHAQQKLQEIIRTMEKQAPFVTPPAAGPDGAMTVKQYIEEHYVKNFLPNLKPGTRRGYTQIINTHILPQLGSMELDKVHRRDIQQLINNVRARNKRRHTLDNIRNLCGSIFREAELDEYIEVGPVHKIKMPPPDPKRRIAVPDVGTVQAIIDHLKEPYHTLVWFVAVMGCRIGEALGLKWGAVDLEGQHIWFLMARYAGREEHLTKGHRADKPVEITDFEVATLKAYKATCQVQGDNDLVFLDHGQPLVLQHCLRQELRKAARKFGVPDLTFHGLRHWAGTKLKEAGVDIKDIQARLGHSRYQTTADWYIEESNRDQQKAAEIASTLLRPSGASATSTSSATPLSSGAEFCTQLAPILAPAGELQDPVLDRDLINAVPSSSLQ